MIMDPLILDWHAEIAAEAFDGIAFQSSALSRFLRRGDDIAALRTYERVIALFKEFAAPEMKVLQANLKDDPDTLSAAASAEWRSERDRSAASRETAKAAA